MRNINHASIASILLASALAACANAQESGGARPQKQTFQFQRSQGDGKSIELRVENGEVRVAKINGEDLPADRVRKVPGGFDIVDGSGKVVEHVAIARGDEPGPGRAGKQRRGFRIETDESRGESVIVPGQPITVIAPNGDGGEPKSMIGAGLGVPDAALAHHLGIDPAKSTLVTVAPDGLPASEAGIEQFDVIVSINGSADASSAQLRAALRNSEPGSKIKLGIRRGADTKMIEVVPVVFDQSKLEQVEVDDGMLVPGMTIGGNADGEGDEEANGNVMFFVGPDGKRHEMRMPSAPTMGMGAFNGKELERRMEEEFNRRMEELDRRTEQRMRQNQGPNMGSSAGPGIAPMPRGPMNSGGNSGGNGGNNGNNNEDRIRRLEERMERLMRELERERAERKNDA